MEVEINLEIELEILHGSRDKFGDRTRNIYMEVGVDLLIGLNKCFDGPRSCMPPVNDEIMERGSIRQDIQFAP